MAATGKFERLKFSQKFQLLASKALQYWKDDRGFGQFEQMLPIDGLNRYVFFRIREHRLLGRHMRRLRNGENLRFTNSDSLEAYEAYDDQEQRDYVNKSVKTLHNGKIARVPFRNIREIYLEEIYRQIDGLISSANGKPVRILEVGCGNCINAKCLLDRYGSQIDYTGIDISPKRLEVARSFWGQHLQKAQLLNMSATEMELPDSSFDLVFTMHVLEQMTYTVGEALDEIFRVAADRIVLIEPTYEFGNSVQKLKLTLNDQLRTLLPEIRKRNVSLVKSYPLNTLANPTNPSGAHVIQLNC